MIVTVLAKAESSALQARSLIYYTCKSGGSDYATGWTAPQFGVRFLEAAEIYSPSPRLSDHPLGLTQPSVRLIPANSSLEIKRLEREFDDLPLSSNEFKNEWSCASIS